MLLKTFKESTYFDLQVVIEEFNTCVLVCCALKWQTSITMLSLNLLFNALKLENNPNANFISERVKAHSSTNKIDIHLP